MISLVLSHIKVLVIPVEVELVPLVNAVNVQRLPPLVNISVHNRWVVNFRIHAVLVIPVQRMVLFVLTIVDVLAYVCAIRLFYSVLNYVQHQAQPTQKNKLASLIFLLSLFFLLFPLLSSFWVDLFFQTCNHEEKGGQKNMRSQWCCSTSDLFSRQTFLMLNRKSMSMLTCGVIECSTF